MDKPMAAILDDDRGFTKVLSAALEKRGLVAAAFQGPTEIIEFAKSHQIGLSFIDLNINETSDGIRVVQALRRQLAVTSPVVMISGTCVPGAFVRALEAGANDFLVKPISKNILESCLAQFLDPKVIAIDEPSLLPATCLGAPLILGLDFSVESVDESGITVQGKHLLIEGSVVSLRGDLTDEIFPPKEPRHLTVASLEPEAATGQFRYHLRFDTSNIPLLTRVRRWILLQNALG